MLTFFLILLGLLAFSSGFSSQIIKSRTSEFNKTIDLRDYEALEKFAQRVGISETYELLKIKFPNNDPQAHDFAHVVGIAAYNKEGMAGISKCDTSYNYGCMHGFMEAFLAENGIDQISEVENACISLGTLHAPSCLHGIGHGVMIDSGYVLQEALEDCHRLQASSQLYCFDGVFMERIVQSMQAPEKKFKVTQETLDYPCNEIAYTYRSQCWRNQATVWVQFYSGESRNAGQRCLMIEPEFRPICVESVGLNIAMTGPKDEDYVARSCAFIGQNVVADECVVGVMKELMFENKSVALAGNLCKYTSVSARAACQQLFEQLKKDNEMRFSIK